jgi:4-amino-4-deoxy-L-arabinose transferase-like glycosyltransferase
LETSLQGGTGAAWATAAFLAGRAEEHTARRSSFRRRSVTLAPILNTNRQCSGGGGDPVTGLSTSDSSRIFTTIEQQQLRAPVVVHITAATRPHASVEAVRHPSVILGALIVVGAYLRLTNLDALGFRWDEDLSALAVRAILEHGIPLLPSGMIYPRGGVFLYMMVASAELFGFGELALRLPAALFGIALIPLAYVFGKSLFDVRVGLIAAALITVSYWDIEFSRYARMYSPFGFCYVLTIYCLWKYRVQSISAAGSALCIALAVFTISLHQLGYTLVLAFYFPLILRGPAQWLKPRNWVYPIAASGIVAAFFFIYSDAITRWMRRPVRLSGQSEPVAASPDAAASVLDKMPLFSGMLDAAPWLLIGLAAVLMAAAGAWSLRSALPRLHRALLLLIALCCVLQLFNVALLAWLGLAFLKREGLAAFRRADVIVAAGLIATAFAAWLILAALFGLGTTDPAQGSGGLKGAIRSLLNYPYFFSFWAYAREWPMMSVVAVIGGAWAFDKASRPAKTSEGAGSPIAARADTAAASGFVLLALATPLIVNGLFETTFEFFRYSVPFNTFYFTLVALALVHWRDVLGALVGPSRRFASSGAAGTVLLSLLVLGFDMSPLRAWLVTRQDHFNDGAVYRAFGMERNSDFKTPGEFVARNAADEDLIIVLDSREYYNYIGRLDYWIRTAVYESQSYRGDDGRLRDSYVGTPLIMSLDELREVLGAPQRRKWLIASDETLRSTRAVTDDIKALIGQQQEHVVYVGRDGATKVYRFD